MSEQEADRTYTQAQFQHPNGVSRPFVVRETDEGWAEALKAEKAYH